LLKAYGINSTIYKKGRFGQSIWDQFNNLQEDKIWAKHMGSIQQSTRRQDLGKAYGINSTIYKKTRFGQSIWDKSEVLLGTC